MHWGLWSLVVTVVAIRDVNDQVAQLEAEITQDRAHLQSLSFGGVASTAGAVDTAVLGEDPAQDMVTAATAVGRLPQAPPPPKKPAAALVHKASSLGSDSGPVSDLAAQLVEAATQTTPKLRATAANAQHRLAEAAKAVVTPSKSPPKQETEAAADAAQLEQDARDWEAQKEKWTADLTVAAANVVTNHVDSGILARARGKVPEPENPAAPLVVGGFYLIMFVVAAIIYRLSKVNVSPTSGKPDQYDGDWRFGLFECCGDFEICAMACCCAPIRWADNMDMLKLITFWLAFVVYLIFSLINSRAWGLVPGLYTILGLVYRQQIRRKFAMEAYTCTTCTCDCLAWSFCSCCAIVQESRHIEGACKEGHDAFRHLRENPAYIQDGNIVRDPMAQQGNPSR
mmetsp:Transcript_53181/g.116688  ORF Transcript_53181/g.116688 Transcript_53181/m.116688 type:complete len:398 (-) Transcript_53181:91-1284(-)